MDTVTLTSVAPRGYCFIVIGAGVWGVGLTVKSAIAASRCPGGIKYAREHMSYICIPWGGTFELHGQSHPAPAVTDMGNIFWDSNREIEGQDHDLRPVKELK